MCVGRMFKDVCVCVCVCVCNQEKLALSQSVTGSVIETGRGNLDAGGTGMRSSSFQLGQQACPTQPMDMDSVVAQPGR